MVNSMHFMLLVEFKCSKALVNFSLPVPPYLQVRIDQMNLREVELKTFIRVVTK